MKERLLELFQKRFNTDSKSKSSQYQKEICQILQSVIDKIYSIESKVGYYANFSDTLKIHSIDEDFPYEELPKIISCNDYEFDFDTNWLDINLEEYFNEIKNKRIKYKETIIQNVENSLNDHKKELEEIKNLNYIELDTDLSNN